MSIFDLFTNRQDSSNNFWNTAAKNTKCDYPNKNNLLNEFISFENVVKNSAKVVIKSALKIAANLFSFNSAKDESSTIDARNEFEFSSNVQTKNSDQEENSITNIFNKIVKTEEQKDAHASLLDSTLSALVKTGNAFYINMQQDVMHQAQQDEIARLDDLLETAYLPGLFGEPSYLTESDC